MSQVNNIITTTFRAREGGLIAQLGSYAQGFGTIYNRLSENSRMSDRLNAQWRAFGTTLRYAIAGQTLFGLVRMYQTLKDINVQIGEMAALTTPGTGGSAFSTRQVDALRDALQRVSIDTLQPLQQVNDAAINFLSTVQNVEPGTGLPRMLEDISKAAQLAQTDLTTLNQAATTSQVAFRRPVNKQTIGQYTRMWQELIFQAPGGPQASTTIAQAMPGLAAMFQMAPGRAVPANVGQAQMMALTLGVLRTGMPAATAMRGLQFLLQSIAQPTGKARGALSRIGITPQFVEQQGIYTALNKLLSTITARGNAKQLGTIPDDVLDQIDASGGTLPGIPANEMLRLREMIPRIHGIRAAIILAGQLQQHGNVTSIAQNLQTMLDVQDENSKQSRALAEAWMRFRKRSRLQEASNAVNTMAIQVAQTFEPVFGYIAEHGLTPIAKAMQRHRTATRVGAISAAGILAALGIGRFLGVGRFGGSAIVRTEAIQAAISGNSALGATPQNPLFVIVVGQLFGGGGSGGSGGGSGGWKRTAEKETEQAAKTAGIFGILKAAFTGVKAAPGAIVAGAKRFGGMIEEYGTYRQGEIRALGRLGLAGIIADYFYNADKAGTRGEDIYYALTKKFPGANIKSFREGILKGEAEVYVNLSINQDGKIINKRVRVPTAMLMQNGRIPSSRGTPGKTGGRNG
jgi:hypothetical protein